MLDLLSLFLHIPCLWQIGLGACQALTLMTSLVVAPSKLAGLVVWPTNKTHKLLFFVGGSSLTIEAAVPRYAPAAGRPVVCGGFDSPWGRQFS